MADKSAWEVFFDGHAPQYMNNPFTRDTLTEVAFLLELFQLPQNSAILDVGCGTGRHAIELAKRGYSVTGVDLSSGMLALAEQAAREAGVKVTWLHADASRFRASRLFDAAICLCQGAFCLLSLEDDPQEHDRAILASIYAALKPGDRFVLTALNGLAKIRQLKQEDVASGRFDPLTLIETSTVECETPEGKRSLQVRERGYLPQELAGLLEQAGFEVEHLWGGTAGRWGRRTVELDEIEVMAVSCKPDLNRLPTSAIPAK